MNVGLSRLKRRACPPNARLRLAEPRSARFPAFGRFPPESALEGNESGTSKGERSPFLFVYGRQAAYLGLRPSPRKVGELKRHSNALPFAQQQVRKALKRVG